MAYFHTKITFADTSELENAPSTILLDGMWYNVKDAGNGYPASYQYQATSTEALVTGVVLPVTNGSGRFKIFGGAPQPVPEPVAVVPIINEPPTLPPDPLPTVGRAALALETSVDPPRLWVYGTDWHYTELAAYTPPPLPDLTLTFSEVGTPFTATDGYVQFRYTINNVGEAVLSGPYSIETRFYISNTTHADRSSVEANSLLIGIRTLPDTVGGTIAIGSNYSELVGLESGFNGSSNWSESPIWAAGSKQLIAIVDYGNTVTEEEETNIYSFPVQVV